tara:strand:- start:171 stop:449 length:279 start_codon:yes stop_codon:yes gene_type:complete
MQEPIIKRLINLEAAVNELQVRVSELESGEVVDKPEWANWKAMDGGGWYYYSSEPKVGSVDWQLNDTNDIFEYCDPQPPKSDKHWTDTLEKI